MARKKGITRRRRYFARRRSGPRKMTLPVAVLAGFASPVARTIDHARFGFSGEEGAIAELSRIMTGVNPFKTPVSVEFWRMRYGLMPIALGVLIHKLAGMLGINRAIAQTGIPFIRI